ncbi:hypothetical protein Nepgr_007081 [Nepenthes gracilis]|uniref:CASP-like protein n=1 Tax=Nepenthes gracilis TaxID=150966 RepID=A0AAD3S6V5_NEPGR|nr:hypothetical protein Nepgr_007081 [Nepenthes gracilis]
MSYVGASAVAVNPMNAAEYHGINLIVVNRRMKVAELVLRVLICALGVLAATLMVTDTQVMVFFSIQKKAKFTDMKALVFLVIANGIAAFYSFLQLLRCVVSLAKGSVLFNKPLAWAIFSGDQVVAYLTVAAWAAALQSSVYAKLGQSELQWMKLCQFYGKFCNRGGEGLASAVMASLCTVIVSAISAFSLFRLYGGANAKTTTGW